MIYFISDGHNHVKIGVAEEPQKRIKELQIGNPYKLEIKVTWEIRRQICKCGDYGVERFLHKILDDFRLEGEWFVEENAKYLMDMETDEIQQFLKDIKPQMMDETSITKRQQEINEKIIESQSKKQCEALKQKLKEANKQIRNLKAELKEAKKTKPPHEIKVAYYDFRKEKAQ